MGNTPVEVQRFFSQRRPTQLAVRGLDEKPCSDEKSEKEHIFLAGR